MNRLYLVICLLFVSIFGLNAQQNWFKGNTHMHTNFSDGDSPIQEVVDWYHDHDYNFISITDHNKTVIPLDHISSDKLRKDFLMIVGNEITSSVHFTALGVKDDFNVKSILKDFEDGTLKGFDLPAPDTTKTGHSQILINGMLDQGAMVFINHPNFSTGISAAEMLSLKGATAIELSNAHPTVYNYGNDRHIPVEEKWDYLLSYGMKIYGVGSDDEHHLQKWGPDAANPGRSWIMVEANELNQDNILEAISNGNFSSSTGVELSKYETNKNQIVVKIDKKKTLKTLKNELGVAHKTEKGKEGFRIEVIGFGGKVIESTDGESLKFNYGSINKYLRIRASYCQKKDGEYNTYYAWCQPIFEEDKN